MVSRLLCRCGVDIRAYCPVPVAVATGRSLFRFFRVRSVAVFGPETASWSLRPLARGCCAAGCGVRRLTPLGVVALFGGPAFLVALLFGLASLVHGLLWCERYRVLGCGRAARRRRAGVGRRVRGFRRISHLSCRLCAGGFFTACSDGFVVLRSFSGSRPGPLVRVSMLVLLGRDFVPVLGSLRAWTFGFAAGSSGVPALPVSVLFGWSFGLLESSFASGCAVDLVGLPTSARGSVCSTPMTRSFCSTCSVLDLCCTACNVPFLDTPLCLLGALLVCVDVGCRRLLYVALRRCVSAYPAVAVFCLLHLFRCGNPVVFCSTSCPCYLPCRPRRRSGFPRFRGWSLRRWPCPSVGVVVGRLCPAERCSLDPWIRLWSTPLVVSSVVRLSPLASRLVLSRLCALPDRFPRSAVFSGVVRFSLRGAVSTSAAWSDAVSGGGVFWCPGASCRSLLFSCFSSRVLRGVLACVRGR